MTLGNYLREEGEKSKILFDLWVCPRPYTRHWGSGQVFQRIEKVLGTPDVAFGVTDGIPLTTYCIDKNPPKHRVDAGMALEADWAHLGAFRDNYFRFGYWDPPYDHLYKEAAREIWRVCGRLAILHTHTYPRAWFPAAAREATIAIIVGPLKQVRCLQVFRKKADSLRNYGQEAA